MEIRAFTQFVVTAEAVGHKLERPPGPLTDDHAGPALRPVRPGRPPELTIAGPEDPEPRP